MALPVDVLLSIVSDNGHSPCSVGCADGDGGGGVDDGADDDGGVVVVNVNMTLVGLVYGVDAMVDMVRIDSVVDVK